MEILDLTKKDSRSTDDQIRDLKDANDIFCETFKILISGIETLKTKVEQLEEELKCLKNKGLGT